jgi:predicted ATPase
VDPPANARNVLARVLWPQGFPDQAISVAESNLQAVQATDHTTSLCLAAGAACEIALYVGDLAGVERYIAILRERSAKLALGLFQALAHAFEGQLLVKRGEFTAGVTSLRAALTELRETSNVARCLGPLSSLAEGLAGAGQLAQGLLVIDEALAHCERTDERWSMADLLRVRGELNLKLGGADTVSTAEALFVEGLDWAGRQETLSWELRCATSLGRLWSEQGHTDKARKLLSAAYGRFIEGLGTADLITAKTLLDSMGRDISGATSRKP